MHKQRRRLKQTVSLLDRIKAFAADLQEQADKTGPGPERDALLKRVLKADTACKINEWANSPGLQPPK